jgi:hypothetical protein
MSKTIQHLLFGFGSFINMFGYSNDLKLSKGGFRGDYERLKQDVNNIKSDFSKVVKNGKQKTRSSR